MKRRGNTRHDPKTGRLATAYEGEATCARVRAFADSLTLERPALADYLRISTEDLLAVHLGVVKQTVLNWDHTHPEFTAALEYWRTRRNAAFVLVMPYMDTARWIFISKQKAFLGYTDRAEVVQSTEPVEIVYAGQATPAAKAAKP